MKKLTREDSTVAQQIAEIVRPSMESMSEREYMLHYILVHREEFQDFDFSEIREFLLTLDG